MLPADIAIRQCNGATRRRPRNLPEYHPTCGRACRRLSRLAGPLDSVRIGPPDGVTVLAARASMHERLIAAGTAQERSDAVAEIVAWGELPAPPTDAVHRVLASLPLLDVSVGDADAPPGDLYAKRIAAVSKVYAMYSPSRWAIYDSRVARGLALLALRLFSGGSPRTAMMFPQPPGRTGARAEGFLALGSERQARLAVVYASWFAQDVALRISACCPDPNGLGRSPCRDGGVHADHPGSIAGKQRSAVQRRRDRRGDRRPPRRARG